jgi:ABC-type Fe3+ transport system substrate-binding protein
MRRSGAVLAAALLVSCGEARETVLIVRSTLPDDLLGRIEETFEAANPDVDVRFTRAHDSTSLAELRSAESAPFDVWWGASGLALERAANRDLLGPYRPAWAAGDAARTVTTGAEDGDDRHSEGEGGDDGGGHESAWHAVLLTPFVIAFNREEVPIARAPLDWADGFHHRWFAEVYAYDPERTEDGGYFLGAILVEALRDDDDLVRGLDWFRRLEPQIARWMVDSNEAIRALRSGDALLAFLPRAVAEAARAGDAPWLHYRVPGSGTPTLVRGVGIVRGTAVEDAARRFVDHIGTVEAVTEAKMRTRWESAHVAVDSTRLTSDFELELPWQGFPLAIDTLVAELDGWVDRWSLEIRGR